MESFKRLQYIYKIIKDFYPKLLRSEASTLFFNFMETTNLKSIGLPNQVIYSPYKKQRVNGQKIGFETPNRINKKYDSVITSIPKSHEEALGQIAQAYQKIKFGGVLFIEGSKRYGIDSIVKALSKKINIEHLSSKAHGKIAIIKVTSTKEKAFANWLGYASPLQNNEGFFSMPGLFSYKRIDPASKFLASIFYDQINGQVIDLGAGWGYLSSKILEKCSKVESITLIDHDQRAIDCAKKI